MDLVALVKTRIAEARNRRGLSQAAAAKLLPFSRAKIAAQESVNNSQNPDVADLMEYAKAYGVTPMYFLSKTEATQDAAELFDLFSSIPASAKPAALDILRSIVAASEK